MDKKRLSMIIGVVVVFVLFAFVSASYSSTYPNASQYQNKADNWKTDLDSATQLGSGKLANPTSSGYVELYDTTASSLNDIEVDMKKTNPPKGYEDFHSCLWNEVDNFKMGYQAMSMARKTDDDTQMANAVQYFKEAHKYEDLANQQERNLGF